MAKISIATNFTNTTLFVNENFTSTVGNTISSILEIPQYDFVTFYGALNNTGAAALAATLTVEVSPNTSTFFTYDGMVNEINTGFTGATQLTFNTGTAHVFTLRDIGAINSLRFTLGIVNQIPSTTFNLRYSARKRDS